MYCLQASNIEYTDQVEVVDLSNALEDSDEDRRADQELESKMFSFCSKAVGSSSPSSNTKPLVGKVASKVGAKSAPQGSLSKPRPAPSSGPQSDTVAC